MAKKNSNTTKTKAKPKATAKAKDRAKTKSKKRAPRSTIKERLAQLRIWTVGKTRKLIRFALICCAIIILAPFLLTILYRFDAIKPTSTLMLGRHLTLQPVSRIWVDFDDVAPALYQSVLMSEDGKFCSHHGIDWQAVNLVISDALDGERPRGASTITMQIGKNLFLWGGRSYLRKVLEVPLALWIDLILPKKRIMEIYLNIAEWDDDGVFGAQAGSQSQFGRSAANLSRRQAAYMAVTLPNPIVREPSQPSKGLTRLARTIERRANQSAAYVKCLK